MSKRISTGLLMFRRKQDQVEVFLAHPGGPYFKNKDEKYWTIPKGEVDLLMEHPDEQALLSNAIREFKEEIGILPKGEYIYLDQINRRDGKIIYVWAFEGNLPDKYEVISNLVALEWPPRTGKKQKFPEIDRAEFFGLETARKKIQMAQVAFLDRLENYLNLKTKLDSKEVRDE